MIYRKKPDELHDPRPVLDAMGRCRHALINAQMELRPFAPVQVMLHNVAAAIDRVAEHLTGDDTYYHAGGSSFGSEDRKWRDSGR